MIVLETLLGWPFEEVVESFTRRDSAIYALGIGLGADPMDEGQLRFLHDKRLQ